MFFCEYSGADAGFQKSKSKFLNKFPAQPYLGYFRYQLTKYQFFEIYYIIITIVIIIVILLLLELCTWAGIFERYTEEDSDSAS